MQSPSSKKYITIKTSQQEYDLSLDEYSRWLSLLEGVEFVSKRVEQLKVRTQSSTEVDWIKPLAFQKYIAERYESMKSDLQELDKTNNTESCTTSLDPILLLDAKQRVAIDNLN
jgi:hypothetical protein